MFPIGTDYRMRTKPWTNYVLVALNVLLYFVGANGQNPLIRHLLLQPQLPHLYQFFTSMFMHANLSHLVGNMLFLWVFGNAINDRMGNLGYLMFYLGGGLMAGLGYLAISGHAPVLGASGAISAVTGAYLVLLPRVQVRLLFWFVTFDVSSLFLLAMQFISNLWMSASVVVGAGASGGVAYVAHSSGYIFGIAAAAGLLLAKMLPRDELDLLHLIKTGRRRRAYRQTVQSSGDPFGYSNLRPSAAKPPKRKVDARVVSIAISEDTAAAEQLKLRRDIAQAVSGSDLPAAANLYKRLAQLGDNIVLPRQQQLDIANHMMSTADYPAAADAYERFIANYAGYKFIADVQLMLGVLYCRYLRRYEPAVSLLDQACAGLTDSNKLNMAQEALAEAKRNLGR